MGIDHYPVQVIFNAYDDAMTIIDERADEEYRRLLYVAMTRAEDRLYLAGYTGKKKPSLESWYDFFHPALSSLGAEMLEDGTIRLENPQTKDPDAKDKAKQAAQTHEALPVCLLEPAGEEKPEAAALRPSRTEHMEPAVHSPLKAGNISRFRRGNLTHKLLEFLPARAQADRGKIAVDFLVRYAPDVSGNIRASIVSETLAILNDPEFADVFGPGSLAEVPVTGKLSDGRIISGQIDRLLVTDEKILIVDYKTNRPPAGRCQGCPQNLSEPNGRLCRCHQANLSR